MLNKSCLICKHRVVLDRRMMFVDFEPEEESNEEHWECDCVDINKLPNIREIIAASFQGEAVKAEVIAKECDQFTLRTGVEEITSTRSESDIFDPINRDTTGITDTKLEVNEQPEKANYPIRDEDFFRASAAIFNEAALTLITGIVIYKVKPDEQTEENINLP